MKSYSPALQAYLATPDLISVRLLLWITARNRGTGAAVTMGLWTGEDTRSFTIGGGSREYLGAGEVLSVEPIISGGDLAARMLRVRVSGLTPGVQAALETYDVRFAPVELHRSVFARETAQLLEESHRIFLGTLDEERWPVPGLEGDDSGPPEGAVDLTLASSARALTRTLTLKKSDEAQKARSGDRGRRYASATAKVFWGMRPQGQGSTPNDIPWSVQSGFSGSGR